MDGPLSGEEKEAALERLRQEEEGKQPETVDEMVQRASDKDWEEKSWEERADVAMKDKEAQDIATLKEEIDADPEAYLEDISGKKPKLDLEARVAAATDAAEGATNTWDFLNDIYEGDNYQKEMTKLNEELVREEKKLSQGLKDAKSSARIADIIKTSINAAAQMYAASKGVKAQLAKPLDFRSRERLREIKDDIDNERRVLRNRIGNAQNLIKESYAQAEREDIRGQREQVQREKTEAAEAKRIQKMQDDIISAQNFNEQQAIEFKGKVDNKKRVIGNQLKGKSDKELREILTAWGVDKAEIDDILKEDLLVEDNFLWFDTKEKDPSKLQNLITEMATVQAGGRAPQKPVPGSAQPMKAAPQRQIGSKGKLKDGTIVVWDGKGWIKQK